jgi:hypothetical protein
VTAGAAADVDEDEVDEEDEDSTAGALTAATGGTETAKMPPGW